MNSVDGQLIANRYNFESLMKKENTPLWEGYLEALKIPANIIWEAIEVKEKQQALLRIDRGDRNHLLTYPRPYLEDNSGYHPTTCDCSGCLFHRGSLKKERRKARRGFPIPPIIVNNTIDDENESNESNNSNDDDESFNSNNNTENDSDIEESDDEDEMQI